MDVTHKNIRRHTVVEALVKDGSMFAASNVIWPLAMDTKSLILGRPSGPLCITNELQ
jgi:hypothetical protein